MSLWWDLIGPRKEREHEINQRFIPSSVPEGHICDPAKSPDCHEQ